MKKNKCLITKFFPTLEDLKNELFIDLEKQEITRISTGTKYTFVIVGTRARDNEYYAIHFSRNNIPSKLRVHRLFFYWKYGYLPRLVDHKDRNRFNNNIDNLRELTSSENCRNAEKIKTRNGKAPTSKYKGVCCRIKNGKARYQVHIRLNNLKAFSKTFSDEDDAGQAYNDKIRELGLEEVSVLNDTPQERARKINLFNEEKAKANYS